MKSHLKRPLLTAKLDSQLFKDFYWMKKELTDFCSQQGLSTNGMKPEIAERVFTFLKTGKKLKPKIEKINAEIDSQRSLTRKIIMDYS